MEWRTALGQKCLIVLAIATLLAPAPAWSGEWVFVERSETVGLDYSHAFTPGAGIQQWHQIAGGLAIGDLNGDGWDDIYAVTGDPDTTRGPTTNPNKLYISNQDGTYSEVAGAWGLDATDAFSAGPLIADFNGDGHRDLIVGGTKGAGVSTSPGRIRVYMNTGSSSFSDTTVASGLFGYINESLNFGFAATDIDKDNDLDLAVAHWASAGEAILLRNNGSAVFTDITGPNMDGDEPLFIFTPIFTDINDDGWDDLLLSSDFGSSAYFLNDQSGSFVQQNNAVLTDENGMGGAAADFDNDGDVDWFTSSIYDTDQVVEMGGNWGVTGNRLYENNGSGVWTDETTSTGVRVGYWGWGGCFGDFNNDMYLDLYHVNGFPASNFTTEDEFDNDPARMFINNGNGTFTEMGLDLGVADTAQGRAVLCFDNERDGDLDILVNNNQGVSRFFQNDLSNGNYWLQVRLEQPAPNHDAIGAKVRLTAGGVTQFRQVIAGGNFESSHPTTQHFGLAGNSQAASIEVTWPDGTTRTWENMAGNQRYLLCKVDPAPPPPPDAEVFYGGFESEIVSECAVSNPTRR